GMFLLAGPAVPSQAGNWFKFRKSDDCPDECLEECPEEDLECPKEKRRCRFCQGQGCQWCRGGNGRSYRTGGGLYGNSRFLPLDPYYCDPRDQRVYSAHGYNVPVTVPLAPMVRHFNYGWGIPSSRISQAGGYAAWSPDRPFSQSGGRLPGGIYPTVYHPTDTTQFGYYYNYVPTWQPRRW
ncbi:MAG: hypothetical protein ACM3U2_05065, partial [Deltaproteobacteria bacterium]